MKVPLPNHTCPLCKKPNACALANSGEKASPCWCRAQKIDSAILDTIPLAQRNQACICASCAKNSLAN